MSFSTFMVFVGKIILGFGTSYEIASILSNMRLMAERESLMCWSGILWRGGFGRGKPFVTLHSASRVERNRSQQAQSKHD